MKSARLDNSNEPGRETLPLRLFLNPQSADAQ